MYIQITATNNDDNEDQGSLINAIHATTSKIKTLGDTHTLRRNGTKRSGTDGQIDL